MSRGQERIRPEGIKPEKIKLESLKPESLKPESLKPESLERLKPALSFSEAPGPLAIEPLGPGRLTISPPDLKIPKVIRLFPHCLSPL
jgi:hypothetical protein